MNELPSPPHDAEKRGMCHDVTIIRDAMQRVSADDYTVRIADSICSGELGELAIAFNVMAEKLATNARRLSRAYEAKVESESRYRELVEKANSIILKWDRDGSVIYLNKFAEHFFGFSDSEIIGQSIIGTIVPETESSGRDLIELMQNICADPASFMNNINENCCKNGERVWVSWNNHPITGSDGTIVEILSVGQDITERIRIKEELMRSEQRFRSFVENVNDVLFALTPSGVFDYVSPQWKVAFGFELSETIGKPFMPFVHPDDVSVCLEFMSQVFSTGEKQSGVEYRVLCKDGRYLWYTANASLITDPVYGTPILVAIGRDITERKMMEKELLKAQKLESISILAGGIAHNFNNVLTGVIGYISFAKKHLNDPDKVRLLLESAEKSSYRAAVLARQLLLFSRGGSPIKKPILVDELVKESVALFLTDTNISGMIDSLPHQVIHADERQIFQAFNNIILNAVHAMPEGGTLVVRVTVTKLTVRNRHLLPAGDYVEIVFTDSGCGIRKEDLHKIYDPYFTTKANGTGLGLSTTFSIINRHGGHIEIMSDAGKSTTVTILLPSSAEKAAEDAITEKHIEQNSKNVSILVMDDEEMIQNFVKEVLNEQGYEVKTCASGEAAVALYTASMKEGKAYSLVILDLVIPGGMGGVQAAKLIRTHNPQAVLVISSGYANDPAVAEYEKYGFSGAIMKPYNAHQLEMTIKQLLRLPRMIATV
ncbi:MAG: PAS domain S-box protein [Desulfuromonadaceae bacterium]